MINQFIAFVRDIYQTDGFIPLHEPRFGGKEKQYVMDAIDSTFVSSVGQYVDRFENEFAAYVGSAYAIATVNGTAALHVALKLAGVGHTDEVITQPLTFVATCNAIKYCGAHPVFVDIDRKTLGLSAHALAQFLEEKALLINHQCINKETKNIIKACVPMHTFGHPVEIDKISELCKRYHITLVEDAAESLGSSYKGKHTGTVGDMGVFSFNGNKIITTGGGGMLVTNDPVLANRAKHITTTAKVAHPWEYDHDEVGYNYRMPNLNAALGCAQLGRLPDHLMKKRMLSKQYKSYFSQSSLANYINEPEYANANFWLNAIELPTKQDRDAFLQQANQAGIMTRPAWKPLHLNPIFHGNHCEMPMTMSVVDCLVNIPSSVV